MDSLIQTLDGIIAETGCYSPLDYLLEESYLGYEDYENWRRGRARFLCDAISGDVDVLTVALKTAQKYVRSLGFIEEKADYYLSNDNHSIKALEVCFKQYVVPCRLLETRFIRQQDVPQMDLFFDNQPAILAKDLINAIVSGDYDRSREFSKKLFKLQPNNELCDKAERLILANKQLLSHPSVLTLVEKFTILMYQLSPLAKQVLKENARYFMAPLWLNLAQQFDEGFYDEKNPHCHEAFCYAQILLWKKAIESILCISGWRYNASLLAEMSTAYARDKQRLQSICILCEYCWLGTEKNMFSIQDFNCNKAWVSYCDQELDGLWGIHYFPVWLLFIEPGLREPLARHYQKITSPKDENVFIVVAELMSHSLSGKQSKQEKIYELRLSLQQAHPVIYQYYLHKIAK